MRMYTDDGGTLRFDVGNFQGLTLSQLGDHFVAQDRWFADSRRLLLLRMQIDATIEKLGKGSR